MDCRLAGGTRDVFRIRGWPDMEWDFASDDGEAAARLRFRIEQLTILPDSVMPHNRFAMWLAMARVEGEVRYRDVRTAVTGTVFYDHPRINIAPQPVAPFGWYLYTPMQFADGSRLAGYYCRDGNGRVVSEYCFGLYMDAAGAATWLTASEVRGLRFDADDKPVAWESEWTGAGFHARLRNQVRPTGIWRAWGGPTVAQTRKENGNIPLVFDVEGDVTQSAHTRPVRGGGLAEFTVRAGHAPVFP